MKWLNAYRTRLVLVVFVIMASTVLPADADDFEGMRPIADAGLRRYVGPDPVVLDGTGSYDPDNSGPLSYTWRQISGPSVLIIDANTATPTIGGSMQPGVGRDTTPTLGGFTQIDVIQECEFKLVVTDGDLTSLPDTVKVIIVPDLGDAMLQQENPPFDPNKPTVIYFPGGDCVTGASGIKWNDSAWNTRANVISFPNGYGPDSSEGAPTYYKYGDMIIVYLSSVAPDYKQPIQAIGFSTGGMPAMDIGIHLNRVYRDPRYAVNRVTQLDAGCRWNQSEDFAWRSYDLFLTSAVDGEQCWIDEYYGGYYSGEPYRYFTWPDELVVTLGALGHQAVLRWYKNSLTGDDMNIFNNGLVAGAYWSVIGPGRNLQLGPTNAYYFRWDGGEQSGHMSIFNEALHAGRLPEPVTLVGPVDVGDPNGTLLTCEESKNAIGYQLLFGRDPYNMVYLLSDTPSPPCELVTAFPFEQCWWTVRAYDENGSMIHADPVDIKAESVIAQTIENAITGQTYASIQQAINDAHPRDEIVVSPGVCQYLENVNFKGKSLTLRSTAPDDPNTVAATVINGGDRGTVVTVSGTEEIDCVLAGLTIIGGTVGVSCRAESVTIRNCTVESNAPNAIEFSYGYEPIIIDSNIIGQVAEVYPSAFIAYWALDEEQGIIAYDSAADCDGTLMGDPLWQPDGGMVGGAIQLDGVDDYISTDWVLTPDDGAFSVLIWIKGGAPGQVILSQTDGANWLSADPSEGKFMTDLSHPPGGRIPPTSLVSEFVITDGKWHRVCFVWDGSHRRLYVDGIMVAEDEQNRLVGSYNGLYIGCGKTRESSSFFSGLIDDVRIYNRVVSP